MSEFENALEEEANKFIKENVAEENAVTEEEKDWAIVFKSVTRTSFKSGARWAREFTVREICEWLESYSKKHDSESAGFFADKIEQHFKDRGGEK